MRTTCKKIGDTRLARFISLMVKYGFTRARNAITVANYDITSKCNLRCQHCYFYKTSDGQVAELSDEQWAQIFKEHYEKGVRIAYITGGEPSLRPEVLRHAHRTFETVVIVSNGTIKVPQDIQRRIFVSLDGDREVHNAIRGDDCFDTMMANVRNDKRVVFTPTLSTANHHLIDEMVKLTNLSGTAGICFNFYTSHSYDGDPLLLQGDVLQNALERIEAARRAHPHMVLMSPRMIRMVVTKEHVQYCGFKKGRYLSYFSDLEPKYPCVLGKNVNCDTCGCIVPIFVTSLLKKADVKGYFVIDRMFPPQFVRRGQ
jgi:MoaA/NifB/PqqE/SkfB family radical SAM enzyme